MHFPKRVMQRDKLVIRCPKLAVRRPKLPVPGRKLAVQGRHLAMLGRKLGVPCCGLAWPEARRTKRSCTEPQRSAANRLQYDVP